MELLTANDEINEIPHVPELAPGHDVNQLLPHEVNRADNHLDVCDVMKDCLSYAHSNAWSYTNRKAKDMKYYYISILFVTQTI
jgi:hypothetical protein